MALGIEVSRDAYRAGELVRGTAHGLSGFSGARGLTVALVHDGDHLKDDDPVEVRLETPAGVDVLPFDLPLPLDALPTFRGLRFGSTWSVRASVDLPLKRDPEVEREIRVLPSPERIVDPGDPVVADTRGTRGFVRGLAIFALVDFFVLAVVYAAISDPPASIVAPLATPLIVSLGLVALLRGGGPLDTFEIEVPRARWRLGETVPVTVRIEGDPGAMGPLEIALTAAEEWTTSSGSTTTNHREVFHEETRRFGPHELAAHRTGARQWTVAVELTVPEVAPPSIGNEVVWDARATIGVPRRHDPLLEAPLEISGVLSDVAS